MSLHKASGKWQKGFLLSFTAALIWGIMPVALKGLLASLDPFTITWYRFLLAAVCLFILCARSSGFADRRKWTGNSIALLVIACFSLSGNYILYLLGLDYVTPSITAVVIQLAPIFMLIGSLVIFKEDFSRLQWAGLFVLLAGLGLFFNDRLRELFLLFGELSIGVVFVIISALLWASYALAQKQLLTYIHSQSSMFLLYAGCTLVFFPFSRPAALFPSQAATLLLLGFCTLGTIIAYGSFAEALDHWDASRVSAVLATSPIITVTVMKVLAVFMPGIVSGEHLNVLSIIGVIVVISGSMLCALGKKPAVIHYS